MKGILLTPDHLQQVITVTEVTLPTEADGCTLEGIRQHLQCTLVEAISCDSGGALVGHIALADEEGLFAKNPGYIWCPQIRQHPLAGRLLLVKPTADGDWVSATVDLDTVKTLPGMVYMLPHVAAIAARSHEAAVAKVFPGVFVAPASQAILDGMFNPQ